MRTLLLAPLLLVPMLLGGCAQADPEEAAAPVRGTSASATSTVGPSPAAPAPTAVVDETVPAGGGAASGGAASPGASSGSGGGSGGGLPTTPLCSGPSLDIALASTDSGAGSTDYRIAFTNRGRTACHVSGAPRAYLIDPTGDQLGGDAEGTGAEGDFVRVAPGASASVDVRVVNVGTDGGPLAGRCTTAPAVAIAIDAPNLDRYEQVPVRTRGCVEKDVPAVSVSVLRGGS